MEKKRFYYLAVNQWGCNRSVEEDNGWEVLAFPTKKLRDAAYDDMDYSRTGAFIPTRKEIFDIYGLYPHSFDESEPRCVKFGPCPYEGDDKSGYMFMMCVESKTRIECSHCSDCRKCEHAKTHMEGRYRL